MLYEKICPNCGTKLSQFMNTYMLGCPHCYQAFSVEIYDSLKKIQAKSYHTGKQPKLSGVERDLIEEYEYLLRQKEKAGEQHRFSDMAEISEQIFQLKEELKRRGIDR